MTWQPIETAPRDGTVFIATTVVKNVSGRRWYETHVIYCDDETGDIHPDCEQGWAVEDYTHWMPLPEPPQ